MNVKKYVLASIVAFVVFSVLDFVMHNIILGQYYAAMPDVWRADMESFRWVMSLATLVMSFGFVYVFTRFARGGDVATGVHYGLVAGVMMNVMGAFTSYALYPFPLGLAVAWFVLGVIEFVIVGAVVAWVHGRK